MESKHDTDADPEKSITDRVHDNSWSANLETSRYSDDPELVVEDAIDAIEQTASENHVNLVTHSAHGHPSEYLYERLDEAFDDLTWEYVDQCGCGGYVTKVFVE